MITQVVELSAEQMHGQRSIASIDGALEIAERLVIVAQSGINGRKTHRRYVVGFRPRIQDSDLSLRFVAPTGHPIAISHLAVQQRTALHLAGVGKIRESIAA